MSRIRDISDKLSTKLNKIRLSRNHPLTKNRVFILLEGNTDIKLFRNIFNHQTTNINQINGKENIKKALQILQNEGFVKIFGIKDADFDNLNGAIYDEIDLFVTDYADMEIQMIESQAFKSLINEFSDENCYEIFIEELKDKLYKEAISIGYLRWYNERYFKEYNRYLLRFKGLNFNNFVKITECNISIDKNNFFKELKKCSNIDLDNQKLEEIIKNLQEISNEYLQICNGHDITMLLAYLFNYKKNSNKSNINQDRIEEALRLSYTFGYFSNTKLFNSLKKWQTHFEIKLFVESN